MLVCGSQRQFSVTVNDINGLPLLLTFSGHAVTNSTIGRKLSRFSFFLTFGDNIPKTQDDS